MFCLLKGQVQGTHARSVISSTSASLTVGSRGERSDLVTAGLLALFPGVHSRSDSDKRVKHHFGLGGGVGAAFCFGVKGGMLLCVFR